VQAREALGHVEFAVLSAVQRGALRRRAGARQISSLREQPGGEAILHAALRRCEGEGLLRSRRDASGRSYELTTAGSARLRTERRFRLALIGVLIRDH
jgi:DNA-binding PadR family transcriptional regulator